MKRIDEQFNKLNEFSNWEITELYSNEVGHFTLGYDGVKSIWEHSAQGEGDRWFYVIEFEFNTVRYVFNPVTVVKKKILEVK